MSTFYYVPQYFTTQLSVAGGIDDTQTTGIVLQSISGVDETKPGIIAVTWSNPIDTTKVEYITYTSINATTKELQGVTRGEEGYSAKSHVNGATVAWPLSKSHINNIPDSTTTFSNKTMDYNSNTFTNFPTPTSSVNLFYNAIINGNMDVAQRGASIALTTANGYTLDRWYVETATAGTDKTVSQEDGTGVNGSRYCARVKMVSDVDELLTFSQALESQDSIKFRGQKVTLSFYARGGAEFVADNATLVSKIVTGKGTDQKVLDFTTSADGVSQNNTLTTGWQKFTCTTTAAIAADITQIGVSFAFTHAGSGTTTNYFEITQVQLCAGDIALPFMPKSFEEELRACQRYYVKNIVGAYGSYVNCYNHTTTNAIGTYNFTVPMRIAPTLEVNSTANKYLLLTNGTTVNLSSVPTIGNQTTLTCQINSTVASGLTVGQASLLRDSGDGTSYLGFSAEL